MCFQSCNDAFWTEYLEELGKKNLIFQTAPQDFGLKGSSNKLSSVVQGDHLDSRIS
jgi:hypothetical protein